MSIAKIDVASTVLKSETKMPSGSAPSISVVQDAMLTKRQTERILCNCSQCNGTKLTPARFESHTGSRRKHWKLIVKVKGTDIKLDNLLTGKKPGVAKTTQRNAPITMKQKVEELLHEQYTPVHARWTTEMCAICRWIEDWDYNKIIICNRFDYNFNTDAKRRTAGDGNKSSVRNLLFRSQPLILIEIRV